MEGARGPTGLTIERDLHFKPGPFSKVIEQYRGRNPRLVRKAQRFNEVAHMCESYLNRRISECLDEIQQYVYGFMASDLGLTTDEVYKVMFPVDCGHNGITIRKTPASVSY